ncbi:MAG: hypothetical protein PHO58_05815 [Bacilli bacterium]|nr:hypothetical protein [Bacilli bacterium]
MEDYINLHEQYMKLQSISLYKMSVKQRNELQTILEKLINHKQSSGHDLDTYYWPRYNSYDNEIKDIKFNIDKQIRTEEIHIMFAQRKIDELKEMLVE